MNADDDSNIRSQQEADQAGMQFARQAQAIVLGGDELSSIKASVLSYAAANPITRSIPSPAPRSWYAAHSMRFATLAIIVLLTGATTVGAERALPGDALYPFKRAINDRAITAVAIGEEAEAHANITLAERRLQEIERIALEVEAPIALADEINEATASAERHIAHARAFIDADAGVAVDEAATNSAMQTEIAVTDAPEQSARSMKMMAVEVATDVQEVPARPSSTSSVDERLAAVISAHSQTLARIKGLKPDAGAVIEVTSEAVLEASIGSSSDETDPVYVDLREEAIESIEANLDIEVETEIEAETENGPGAKADSVDSEDDDEKPDPELKAEVKGAVDSLLSL